MKQLSTTQQASDQTTNICIYRNVIPIADFMSTDCCICGCLPPIRIIAFNYNIKCALLRSLAHFVILNGRSCHCVNIISRSWFFWKNINRIINLTADYSNLTAISNRWRKSHNCVCTTTTSQFGNSQLVCRAFLFPIFCCCCLSRLLLTWDVITDGKTGTITTHSKLV